MPTPMTLNEKLQQEDDSEMADEKLYRSLVGSLIYLTNTRPDIVQPVSVLSRFMSKPSKVHYAAAKRVLRFLQGTMKHGLRYVKESNNDLVGFTDSDWVGSLEDRRSVLFQALRRRVQEGQRALYSLGAKIAVLAFSPSGKPFSYGHPSVESILERFLSSSVDAAPATPPRHPPAAVLVQALGRQEKELQEWLEAGGPVGDLLAAEVEELGLPELDLLQSTLECVRAESLSRARQLACYRPTGKKEASGGGFSVPSTSTVVPGPLT
ncbi:hypothetical protein ZIOFF_015733 [Zingiber officinale]|uniref:MADS-box domain-containing protein n=1 Tax=Zingiber officinale TaxID=94328 RepID=A0A8J5LQH1_ZINOF|nr:hypothetical protein ZIOFF_015733 [Zingiber officinale]